MSGTGLSIKDGLNVDGISNRNPDGVNDWIPPDPPAPSTYKILLENGDFLLLEIGDKINSEIP